MTSTPNGASMILTERMSVINKGEFSPQHDEQHINGELLEAARAYIAASEWAEADWPFEPEGFKPSEDPVRNLVKAGQFIAAEIDRLLAERNEV